MAPEPLPPGRFAYAPINDRPIIKWPNNARVALWVAPNMEMFEYVTAKQRPQRDIKHYTSMEYGYQHELMRKLQTDTSVRINAQHVYKDNVVNSEPPRDKINTLRSAPAQVERRA